MDVSNPPPSYDETYGANQQYPPPVGYPTPQGYPQPGTQYPPPQGYPQPGVQYPPVQGYPQQGVQYPPTTVVTANQPYGNVTVVDQTLPPGYMLPKAQSVYHNGCCNVHYFYHNWDYNEKYILVF